MPISWRTPDILNKFEVGICSQEDFHSFCIFHHACCLGYDVPLLVPFAPVVSPVLLQQHSELCANSQCLWSTVDLLVEVLALCNILCPRWSKCSFSISIFICMGEFFKVLVRDYWTRFLIFPRCYGKHHLLQFVCRVLYGMPTSWLRRLKASCSFWSSVASNSILQCWAGVWLTLDPQCHEVPSAPNVGCVEKVLQLAADWLHNMEYWCSGHWSLCEAFLPLHGQQCCYPRHYFPADGGNLLHLASCLASGFWIRSVAARLEYCVNWATTIYTLRSSIL